MNWKNIKQYEDKSLNISFNYEIIKNDDRGDQYFDELYAYREHVMIVYVFGIKKEALENYMEFIGIEEQYNIFDVSYNDKMTDAYDENKMEIVQIEDDCVLIWFHSEIDCERRRTE